MPASPFQPEMSNEEIEAALHIGIFYGISMARQSVEAVIDRGLGHYHLREQLENYLADIVQGKRMAMPKQIIQLHLDASKRLLADLEIEKERRRREGA